MRGSIQSTAGSRAPTPTLLGKRPIASISRQSSGFAGHRQPFQRSSSPTTPSLTRKASYDADATTAGVEEMQYTGNGADDAVEDESFGPCIAAFPGHEV